MLRVNKKAEGRSRPCEGGSPRREKFPTFLSLSLSLFFPLPPLNIPIGPRSLARLLRLPIALSRSAQHGYSTAYFDHCCG